MAKTLMTFKAKCFNATKNQNGAQIQFAKDVEQTAKGPAAREVIMVNAKDTKLVDAVEINGKEYTITVSE